MRPTMKTAKFETPDVPNPNSPAASPFPQALQTGSEVPSSPRSIRSVSRCDERGTVAHARLLQLFLDDTSCAEQTPPNAGHSQVCDRYGCQVR